MKSFSPKVDVKKKEGQSKKIEQQKKVEKILSKQKTIGPTKQFISHHLEKKHEEERLKKLEEYAATHPEVEVSPYGNLTTSSYGEFIQKYGKNLDKFASSWETPMVIQGAGELVYGLGKLGTRYLPQLGEYLTTQTPLKNTYKINPWAFKPNPEAYYRRIGGDEGLDDLLTSGEVRASQIHHTKNLQGINLAKAHTEPYFSIGVPFDTRYGPKNQFYKGPYTLELKNHPMTGKVNGKLSRKANIGVPLEPVYLDNPNLKIYKEDWLKGYKEVPKPKSTFKSEKEKLNYGGVIKTDNMKKDRKRKAQMGYTDKTGKKFIVPKQQEMLEDDIPTIQLSDEEIAATSGKKHVNNLVSDWDNSGYLAERNGFRPNNLSEILASGLMAVNYMLPEERTKWPVVRPQLSYNPYPQGTGSQAIAKNGITLSETGYKRNSKDKNKSKLRIPSNMITMEDVDFPVLGTSDNGITKIMYPGENHVFPGANFVDEERVVAKNGYIIPDISKNRKKFKHGGKIQPLTDNVIQFNGPSHADGGIDIEFGNKQVEVEGGETGYLSPIDNSFNVMGNMINPITGKKFKQDSKILAKKEQKVDKLLDYSLDLVENSNPRDKWDMLKFNSGAAQLQGAYKKKQQIQESKEHLSTIQKAMLDFANENGADPIQFSKGGIIFPRKKQILGKAQAGDYWKIPASQLDPDKYLAAIFSNEGGKTGVNPPIKGNASGKYALMPATQKDIHKKYFKDMSWNDFKNKYDTDAQFEYKVARTLAEEKIKESGTAAEAFGSWYYPKAIKQKKYDFVPEPGYGNKLTVRQYIDRAIGNYTGNKNEARKDSIYRTEEEQHQLDEAMKTETFNIKKKPGSFGDYEYNPQKVGRSNYNLELTNPDRIQNDSYLRDLSFEQIAPELLVAATNKPEPVFMQEYTPDLYQPYNVSFQDQLNENTATFKPLMKYNAKNPAVQATLAAQKYGADQSVLANEFRTNQGIEADIVNKNIALLNDAELKNLQLADTQYVRQDKARSNTRIQNIGILQSISDKLVQNEAEKRNFQVMKNLFPYYSFDKNYNVNFGGPSAGEMLTPISMDGTTQQNATVIKSSDNKGNKKETTVVKPTVNQQMDQLNLDRRKLQNVQWIADMLRGPRNRFGN